MSKGKMKGIECLTPIAGLIPRNGKAWHRQQRLQRRLVRRRRK